MDRLDRPARRRARLAHRLRRAGPARVCCVDRETRAHPELSAKTVAVNAAVGPSDGTVLLSSTGSGGDSNSSIVRPGDAGAHWEVEQMSFSTLLVRAGLDGADFVKMDTDGTDYDLVPSMPPPPTTYVGLHPKLLVDKRSVAAFISSSLRTLRANRRFLRAVLQYKHHYVYDEQNRTFRDIRPRNVLRVLLPL